MLNVRGVRVGSVNNVWGVRNLLMWRVILVRVYILYCVHLINIVLFKASSYEFNDSVFL